MPSYLLTHDLGTSANKAALLDEGGHILKTHTEAIPLQNPRPGWVQQQPELWWQAFCRCTREVLKGVHPGDVAGVGITGQMMCCLALGAGGEVLYPGILWADTRAEAEAAQLEAAVGAEAFYNIVGMRAAANYALPKMMWLKKNEPGVYARTAVFLTPKDYLNYRLCGRMATDPENAAYLHGCDLHSGAWSETLLQAAGLPKEKLPDILPAASVLGGVRAAAAAECGLPEGTPVAVSTGDGAATTLGTATIEPGEGYISLGTSSWVCVVGGSHQMDPARSISKLKYMDSLRDSGTMQAGGYACNWLLRTLCGPEEAEAAKTGRPVFALLDELAESAPPGAGGLLFLPYLLGERAPLWDARLRGAFLGLSGGSTRADMARSVLEGVAFHMNSIFQTILAVNGMKGIKGMRMVGGGAKSAIWRQIFADVFGVPISTTQHPEQAGVLGAAVLAGMALGLYRDASVIRSFQQVTGTTAPRSEMAAFYEARYKLFIDAEKALRDVNHRLAALAE